MKELNGLLLVNKAAGMTSHDVVARARRILGIKSIGHCGTLDPMARGLMVLLIGEATKLSQYILEGDKSYRLELKLGVTSDTLDSSGKVLSETLVQCSPETVIAEAQKLQGEFQLPVPMYSAVKVDGQKLYDYARSGKTVDAPIKLMKFWDLHLVKNEHPTWTFDVSCSKGSYIRAWIHELGMRLACGAVMTGLERTYSTPYSLTQSETLEEIESQIKLGASPHCFVPMSKALPMVKRLRIRGLDQKLLSNGQISNDLRTHLIQAFDPDKDTFVQVLSHDNDEILALIGLEEGKGFTIRRIFRTSGSRD